MTKHPTKEAVKSETDFLKEFITSIFKHKGRRPAEVLHHYFWQAPKTATLIMLNIIAFIIMVFLPEKVLLELLHYPSNLFTFKWHTLITAGFLHASIGHLLGNMLALLVFGRQVEKRLGGKTLLVAYFGALIISGVFHSIISYLWFGSNTPGLGASGAIMGIVALAMLLAPFAFTYIMLLPLPISIVGWLYVIADVSGLLGGVQDNVGRWAHLGGYLSVTIIGLMLGNRYKKELRSGALVNLGTLLVVLLVMRFF